MSPFIILCLLVLCMCLNTTNARPHQDLKPDINIGLKLQLDSSDGFINVKQIDEGHGKLLTSVARQEKDAKALGSWLNAGKNFAFPSAKTKLETAQVKEYKLRKQTRMLESTMDKSKESVDPKEKDMGEDIVVMDYAQPHRKPPIHNMTP